MTFFPDVNVWLALIVAEHVHFGRAQAWAGESGGDWLALNRITQMGVMRLLTNSAVMGGDVMTGVAAWGLMDELREHENIRFAHEPAGLEKAWRDLTPPVALGPNYWTDAYLAAFARTTGFTLVTFDRGFSKYRDIPVRIL